MPNLGNTPDDAKSIARIFANPLRFEMLRQKVIEGKTTQKSSSPASSLAGRRSFLTSAKLETAPFNSLTNESNDSISATPKVSRNNVGDEGLEQIHESAGETRDGAESGAVRSKSGASGREQEVLDADLVSIIRAWPSLPEAAKVGIMAMVRCAATDRDYAPA